MNTDNLIVYKNLLLVELEGPDRDDYREVNGVHIPKQIAHKPVRAKLIAAGANTNLPTDTTYVWLVEPYEIQKLEGGLRFAHKRSLLGYERE